MPLAVAALLAVATGCKDRFEHQRLGASSPEHQAVAQMLHELRDAGEEGFEPLFARQRATDLDKARVRMLRGAMARVAADDRYQLDRVDAFGPAIFRATLASDDPSLAPVAFLLVRTDDGQYYWMGTN